MLGSFTTFAPMRTVITALARHLALSNFLGEAAPLHSIGSVSQTALDPSHGAILLLGAGASLAQHWTHHTAPYHFWEQAPPLKHLDSCHGVFLHWWNFMTHTHLHTDWALRYKSWWWSFWQVTWRSLFSLRENATVRFAGGSLGLATCNNVQ